MKRIAMAIAGVLIAGAAVMAAPVAANAHTPSISASCSGVILKATAYDGKKNNRWSVTINGVRQSGEFGASYSNTFPVPQDGAVTTWSASIAAFDGSYKQEKSGTVGPCGTVPVIVPQVQDYIDCDTATFVLDNTGSNRDVVYVINGVSYPVAAGGAPHVPVEPATTYTVTAPGLSVTFPGKISQSADPEGPCFDRPAEPERPEPEVTEVIVNTSAIDCDSASVVETFEVTTLTKGWIWNEETKGYDPVAASSVYTEDRERPLTETEFAQQERDCLVIPPTEPPTDPEPPVVPPVEPPVVPETPVNPETPVVPGTDVPTVDEPVTDKPVERAVIKRQVEQLAETGVTEAKVIGSIAFLLIFVGSLALVLRTRERRNK